MPVIQTNNTRAGTCPHGLPLGSCPICNGMGANIKKADFSAKPGEMSWNECAAIGAFLKAQKNARLQREQDAQNATQQAKSFQKSMMNASQKMINTGIFFIHNFPPIIAKPINFIMSTILGTTFKIIENVPSIILNTIQTFQQKFVDISDKLTAMFGEIKTGIEKRLSENFKDIKKKIKSLFAIFEPLDADNDDKKIEEEKRTFEMRTFIHHLYKKITKKEDEYDS